MLALAKRWKIHRTTVAEHLRRAGVETRRQGIPTEKLDEVITLYNHGWSCLQLAERYGCNAETVRTYLKGVGITFRKPWEKVR
jgi:DNA-binding CsgD family transcriptional regulator